MKSLLLIDITRVSHSPSERQAFSPVKLSLFDEEWENIATLRHGAS